MSLHMLSFIKSIKFHLQHHQNPLRYTFFPPSLSQLLKSSIPNFSLSITESLIFNLLRYFDVPAGPPIMSPVISEVLLSGLTISSTLRRRTHLVQSFSVAFLHWFYVFS
nr:uncharacterized protein LOC107810382 [Ipomoea batatas]